MDCLKYDSEWEHYFLKLWPESGYQTYLKPKRDWTEGKRASSEKYLSCMDCEHFRVGNEPYRRCKRKINIWIGNAEDEFKEMGYTNADRCKKFELAKYYGNEAVEQRLQQKVVDKDW